jgi:esterase/lipase superfamily enzyme
MATSRAIALLLTGLSLTGCSKEHLRMATPMIYDSEGSDPFAGMPEADQTTTFEVFYATDRVPAENPAKGPAYGDVNESLLRLGRASVTMGGGGSWSEVMAASRSGEGLERDYVAVTETREDGVLPSSLVPNDPNWGKPSSAGVDFAAAIDRKLARSTQPDILIFVPGYKVDFEFPIRKGAELWHFLGRDGAMIAFAWSSRLGRFDYLADLEMSAVSSRNLRLLIEFLAANTSVRRIHLLSHSAGTRVLVDALIQLRIAHLDEDAKALRRRLRLGQIVYAGSEIPFPVFGVYYADRLYEIADQTTIYTSQKDSALGLSGWLLEWPRLGEIDLDDFRDEGREFLDRRRETCFVDVTNAEGATAGNGHWYFTSSPWVASDLVLLLRYDLAPPERGLARHPDGPVWIFPSDYALRARAVADIRLKHK